MKDYSILKTIWPQYGRLQHLYSSKRVLQYLLVSIWPYQYTHSGYMYRYGVCVYCNTTRVRTRVYTCTYTRIALYTRVSRGRDRALSSIIDTGTQKGYRYRYCNSLVLRLCGPVPGTYSSSMLQCRRVAHEILLEPSSS